MPNPTHRDVHISSALTNLAVMYRNNAFVASQILPWLPVDKATDYYYIFGTENISIPNTQRAPGDPSNEWDYTISNTTYACQQHALSKKVPDEVQNNADAPLDPKANATTMLTDVILLDLENDAASNLTSTAVLTNYTTLSGTNQWSDFTNSDPFSNVATAADSILQKARVKPNVMLMGQQVYEKIRNHPDILDRIKYTQKGIVTPDLLATCFDVEKVLVGSAVKNTALEGAAASLSYVWGKNVILGYVNPRPAIDAPSLGYNFTAKSMGEITFNKGFEVRTWRDDKRRSDYVEVTSNWDDKVVGVNCGYLITAVVA